MLKVVRLDSRAKIPTRTHATDAGLDLYAIEPKTLWTNHEVIKIRTGIAIEIPDGYFGKIFDRSSVASKSVYTCGGVIDSSYRGEIIVCMYNNGRANYQINPGDKIAQLVIMPCSLVMPIEVETLSNTDRQANGFGSSGK